MYSMCATERARKTDSYINVWDETVCVQRNKQHNNDNVILDRQHKNEKSH